MGNKKVKTRLSLSARRLSKRKRAKALFRWRKMQKEQQLNLLKQDAMPPTERGADQADNCDVKETASESVSSVHAKSSQGTTSHLRTTSQEPETSNENLPTRSDVKLSYNEVRSAARLGSSGIMTKQLDPATGEFYVVLCVEQEPSAEDVVIETDPLFLPGDVLCVERETAGTDTGDVKEEKEEEDGSPCSAMGAEPLDKYKPRNKWQLSYSEQRIQDSGINSKLERGEKMGENQNKLHGLKITSQNCAKHYPFNYSICPKQLNLENNLKKLLYNHSKGKSDNAVELSEKLIKDEPDVEILERNARKETVSVGSPYMPTIECDRCRGKFDIATFYATHSRGPCFFRVECAVCPFAHRHKHALLRHLKRAHPALFPWTCGVCGEKGSGDGKRAAHGKIHASLGRPLKMYWCHVCSERYYTDHEQPHTDFKFRYKSSLMKHLQEMHPAVFEKEAQRKANKSRDKACNELLCHICGLQRVNEKCFAQHLLSHTCFRTFKCVKPRCGRRFYTAAEVGRHAQSCAPKPREKRYCCDVCGKQFRNQSTLKIHSRVHDDDTADDFGCVVCGKRFRWKSSAKTHLESHLRHPSYFATCDICGIQVTRRRIRDHILLHVDGSKNHACVVCDRAFRRPDTLRTHMRLHGDVADRRFVCTACGERFNHKCSLQAHAAKHGKARSSACGKK